jgi:hypothetical protein
LLVPVGKQELARNYVEELGTCKLGCRALALLALRSAREVSLVPPPGAAFKLHGILLLNVRRRD